jgi:hypothetical protein
MEVDYTSNAILREIERETANLRLIAAARRATREQRRDDPGDPPRDHPDPRLVGVTGQAA